MKPLVLICSRDPELYLILSHILEVDGFRSELASAVDEVVAVAVKQELLAVLLDCHAASGTESIICARLKQEPLTSGIPVVALVSRDAQHELIGLLKAGVDETMVRPLVPARLLDYLHAQRRGFNRVENGHRLYRGGLEMEVVSHRIRRNGHDIHLGLIEFNLLRHLFESPGKVFSREELITLAWPNNIHVGARTVDVHISRLRKTLKSVSSNSVIHTIRSLGYSLEASDG
ncbi:response regulator transcription factor [Rhizobium calliandrae]|uniref:Response regulator transcription factor n=1 Tax=Rhizobium calliandrae TaxID=1312182 RepID=A0ABT7KP73_9HYPH|nr:response regulator transcription factor [Rhizobium calliandrae]MDL2410421.1 response regulator transcription factor [Rhizobium calliandrae]